MSLPLLDYTSGLYSEIDLSDFGLIACQHLLGTTIDLFEELFKKGLRPENTYVIGKCYSTNEQTLQRLQKIGVDVSSHSISFDPKLEYDVQFESHIANFAKAALKKLKGIDQLIVLDDGGCLLEYMNGQELNNSVFGIEQTTSGYEKLKGVELNFPIINVARSHAKIKYESPHIVQRILDELKDKINLSRDMKVLVIGQGAIGSRLKKELGRIVDVYGCDKNGDICDFNGSFSDKLKDFDLVIGATGARSVSEKDLGQLKDGVRLVSVSSSDREFPSRQIRVEGGQHSGGCHDEYVANGTYLMNGGFPINFTGSKHSLPPEHAQLTRSLLLAGVCESVETSRSGFIDLSAKQNDILIEYQLLTNDENS